MRPPHLLDLEEAWGVDGILRRQEERKGSILRRIVAFCSKQRDEAQKRPKTTKSQKKRAIDEPHE